MAKDELKHTRLVVKDKSRLEMNGVVSVESFDSTYVLLETGEGRIGVEGEGLKIESLLREGGEIEIIGRIGAIYYTESKKKSGVFSRIFG